MTTAPPPIPPNPPAPEATHAADAAPPAVLDLEAASAWIAENRTLAMLGAFAVGVFLGVMLRD